MIYQQRRILGAALAGGHSQRFGSDKRDAIWQGRGLLDHTISALAAVTAEVAVCGGANQFISKNTDVLADWPEPGLGPLGGLCAALVHARDNGFDSVLSAPVDAHPIPDDLLDLLSGQSPAVLRDHWLFGLWPSDLAGALDDHLRSGKRSVVSWIEACGARYVDYHGQPPVNINTPPMLAAQKQKESKKQNKKT